MSLSVTRFFVGAVRLLHGPKAVSVKSEESSNSLPAGGPSMKNQPLNVLPGTAEPSKPPEDTQKLRKRSFSEGQEPELMQAHSSFGHKAWAAALSKHIGKTAVAPTTISDSSSSLSGLKVEQLKPPKESRHGWPTDDDDEAPGTARLLNSASSPKKVTSPIWLNRLITLHDSPRASQDFHRSASPTSPTSASSSSPKSGGRSRPPRLPQSPVDPGRFTDLLPEVAGRAWTPEAADAAGNCLRLPLSQPTRWPGQRP